MELITKIDSEIRAPKKQTTLSWCHLMAKLVSQTFPVKMVDGYWAHSFQHSWIETKSGHIIDVSPIACRSLPVMYPGMYLKEKKWNWKNIFVEAKTKKDKDVFTQIRESKKYLDSYESAMQQTMRIRKRYTKMYQECCTNNKIKPYKI